MKPNFAADLSPVLAAWSLDCRPSQAPISCPGGLSGSLVWRLESPCGPLCLRRWPVEHPSAERLRLIHAVLKFVADGGMKVVPRPLATTAGETLVQSAGHFWELAPWLPGAATLSPESPSGCLTAAMHTLAKFHIAAEGFPSQAASPRPAPGIRERLEKTTVLLHGGAERLAAAVAANRGVWPELAELGGKCLATAARHLSPLQKQLQHAAGIHSLLQPCIRDIHREHVLFENGEVSGLIDFGALRIDHPAGDVARLLGSVAKFGSPQWDTGLNAYAEVRPFVGPQREMIEAFHRSGVVLAGVHWLQWVFVEDRLFDDRPAVLRRFIEILDQLSQL